MKVCHVTSVHQPEDIRIFHKECVSLSKAGHEVYLVERGDSYTKNGIRVIGIGAPPKGKLSRIRKTSKKAYQEALKINCDVYHLHDPELLPYAIKLKKRGKIVIFDSHEDIPAQIRDKEWIPSFLRAFISALYVRYETKVSKRIDVVVAATPYIASRFEGRAQSILEINNFPNLDDILFHETPFENRDSIVCYVGGISVLRGEKTMIEAMKSVNGKLMLAGHHEKQCLGDQIHYVGQLNREEVNNLYGESVVGLCVLKAAHNYINSQPIKMYEYMAAGIPFICSNFPGWERVANESKAGVCVDPEDVKQISNAINQLLNERKKAQKMGENGRAYVEANCNWHNEEKKLCELYASFLK